MAFDAAGDYVFITLQDSNEVMAINLKTLKKEWVVPVGPTPAGIVMTPDNRYLLVGIMGEGYVEVIDWRTQKTVKKVPTDTAAHNLHPRGDGRHYFVSNRSVGGGSISLFDTQTLTVVEKYDVPGGPDDMEVRADGSELWATARFARRVQVIDLKAKTLKVSIPVGNSPHGVFFLNHAARK
jgi:YVTN family beta-propeller protein